MANGSSIIQRLIQRRRGNFSTEHARYILSLEFSAAEKARCARLSEKAAAGKLSAKEAAVLDEYLAANAILGALQSRARVSLR